MHTVPGHWIKHKPVHFVLMLTRSFLIVILFVLPVHVINKMLSYCYDSLVIRGVEPYRKLLMSRVTPEDTEVMSLVIFWGIWGVI